MLLGDQITLIPDVVRSANPETIHSKVPLFFQDFQPTIVLIHNPLDPFKPDHPVASQVVQKARLMYVYEPGGNRFEVANAGTRLILAPDWEPIVWSEAERKKGQAWELRTIESFHIHGTPPIEQF